MISREQMIRQSVQTYGRRQIFDVRGYPEDRVEWLDAFPKKRIESEPTLDKNYVSAGFNFDAPARPLEMGSGLKEKIYTIEFFVFALDTVWGENLSSVLKFALDHDGTIPLLDLEQVPPVEVDRLMVDSVTNEHQPVRDPRPWEVAVWTVTTKVRDEYDASLA